MSKQISTLIVQEDFNNLVEYIYKREGHLLDEEGNVLNQNILTSVVEKLYYDKRFSGETFYITFNEENVNYVNGNIDYEKSNVVRVELRPNSSKEKTFPKCRFYYVTDYWDAQGNQILFKPKEFEKTYNMLKYYIRKKFIIRNDKFDYMGPYCYEKYLQCEDSSPNDLLYTDDEWHQMYSRK